MVLNLIALAVIGVVGVVTALQSFRRIDPGALRWSFLSFLCSGIIWMACLSIVQLPAPTVANWISRAVFASMQMTVILLAVFAYLLVSDVGFARRADFRIFLLNHFFIIAACFLTDWITSGVVIDPTTGLYKPARGIGNAWLVASNIGSAVWIYGRLLGVYRTGSTSALLKFQIKSFGKTSLFTFVAVATMNGVLAIILDTAKYSFVGPLAFLVLYYGCFRLLSAGRRDYLSDLFAEFVRNNSDLLGVGENMLRMGQLVRAMNDAINASQAGEPYRLRMSFAGGASLSISSGSDARGFGLEEQTGISRDSAARELALALSDSQAALMRERLRNEVRTIRRHAGLSLDGGVVDEQPGPHVVFRVTRSRFLKFMRRVVSLEQRNSSLTLQLSRLQGIGNLISPAGAEVQRISDAGAASVRSKDALAGLESGPHDLRACVARVIADPEAMDYLQRLMTRRDQSS